MKITVTMKDNCKTAVIKSENGFFVELNNLDNSFPIDSDAIFNALFDNRSAFGIPDSSWKDGLDDSEYPISLQYVDFVSSFGEGDGENRVVWDFGGE